MAYDAVSRTHPVKSSIEEPRRLAVAGAVGGKGSERRWAAASLGGSGNVWDGVAGAQHCPLEGEAGQRDVDFPQRRKEGGEEAEGPWQECCLRQPLPWLPPWRQHFRNTVPRQPRSGIRELEPPTVDVLQLAFPQSVASVLGCPSP